MPVDRFATARLLLLVGLSMSAIQNSVAQLAHAPHEQARPEQADQLVIELSSDTGPVLHGASGWLYGQSAPGIPTVNIMEPLSPQISAQKPDGGEQHPMGDASLVAPDFRAAGGKLMQIYMQDIYPDWTYNNLGIDEYLRRVDAMTRHIVASPNHDLFVYVPFNEPNNNWYADNGPKFTKFMHDWVLVYREIRSIDPSAKIAGPGFEHFNGAAFKTFLQFAKDNHVLPDEFTWHELHDDFFPEWYHRVAQYRASEKNLGIGPLPIVINEYARDRGDLAVPGNLVQWVARLEDSKVYGCLAFWTPSGTLADLAARIWPNRPTGAWWLYRWYGAMAGDTVRVTPPNRDAVGLQGIAALDRARQQVRMIFGGTSKPIRLELNGLEQIAAFKNGVHVSLSRIASSGIEPSSGPESISETNRAVSGHQLVLAVPAGAADAAYSLILTPASAAPPAHTHAGQQLMAVDADFNAGAVYSDPRGSMVLLGSSDLSKDESVRFVANVARDGYYLLGFQYSASQGTQVQLRVDDQPDRTLELASHPGADRGMQTQRLFLAAGVHRFRFTLIATQATRSLGIHSMSLEDAGGHIDHYEARSGGTAPGAEAHQAVTGVGESAHSLLEFRHVMAQAPGQYAMVITYANDEKGHKGQVDEETGISVNGAPATSLWFRNTFSETVFATTVVTIRLKAGENRVQFTSNTGQLPSIADIQIAKEDQ
jgi:hypothetical protein